MVVAADVAPIAECLGIGQLIALGVVLHDRELGAVDLRRGPVDRFGRHRQQQVTDGRVITHRAHELAHHGQPAGAGDRAGHRAGRGVEVTGDDPGQRRLARAVRPDQRHPRTLAHPQAHLAQQRPAVG